jgi:hypothetical protein
VCFRHACRLIDCFEGQRCFQRVDCFGQVDQAYDIGFCQPDRFVGHAGVLSLIAMTSIVAQDKRVEKAAASLW